MQKVILNNGVEMPILGFGVFQIEDPNQCEQVIFITKNRIPVRIVADWKRTKNKTD